MAPHTEKGDRGRGTAAVVSLRVIAVTLLVGGAVRLAANKAVFHLFGIGELWTEHAYFHYIYRVLGAFVALAGILLLIVSRNIERYSALLMGFTIGFTLLGLVMIASGLTAGLSPRHYVIDPAYSLLVAGVCGYVCLKVQAGAAGKPH
jgi:hypothetical protein